MDGIVDGFVVFLNTALQTEFTRTCAIFSLAAFVHARQVRKEIKAQFGELVSVLRADLQSQGNRLSGIENRVDRLEITKGK